jgi:hypothetical protein
MGLYKNSINNAFLRGPGAKRGIRHFIVGFRLGKIKPNPYLCPRSQTHQSNRIMFKLFIQGGAGFMTILTILLVAIFFAAWKAPRWIKEIGEFALVFGLMTPMFPLYQFFTALQEVAADRNDITGLFDLISPGVLFAGKVIMIPVIYGMMIYLVSLVLRIVKKPRL